MKRLVELFRLHPMLFFLIVYGTTMVVVSVGTLILSFFVGRL